MIKKITNELKDKFLNMLVKEGKSIPSIAEKLDIDVEMAYNLQDDLDIEIIDMKAKEYDKIVQRYGLNHLNQFKYNAELYKRLKAELDKRDFTGLPTDKLYAVLMDVQDNINLSLKSVNHSDDFDDEYLDDFDDENDVF